MWSARYAKKKRAKSRFENIKLCIVFLREAHINAYDNHSRSVYTRKYNTLHWFFYNVIYERWWSGDIFATIIARAPRRWREEPHGAKSKSCNMRCAQNSVWRRNVTRWLLNRQWGGLLTAGVYRVAFCTRVIHIYNHIFSRPACNWDMNGDVLFPSSLREYDSR